jgi:hypothetical protein
VVVDVEDTAATEEVGDEVEEVLCDEDVVWAVVVALGVEVDDEVELIDVEDEAATGEITETTPADTEEPDPIGT